MNDTIFLLKVFHEDDNYTESQQEAFRILEKGGQYLSIKQAEAIVGFIPMTQHIFDSIMECREKVGEKLDDLMWFVFQKYEDFAAVHCEKLEKILFPNGICEDYDTDQEENRIGWNKLRKRILDELGEDIGEYRETGSGF